MLQLSIRRLDTQRWACLNLQAFDASCQAFGLVESGFSLHGRYREYVPC